MVNFGEYSPYYNLLYRDKDYAGEVEVVNALISRYHPRAQSVLDLGCGTGRHAKLLARKGYHVWGIDSSPQMLTKAAEGMNDLVKVEFRLGDIRSVRLVQTFDVVTALFHVISYQTGNADLWQSLVTVERQLNLNGILIFDCWYGPAVLEQKPMVRIKRVENETMEIIRLAEPELQPETNTVAVNYHLFIKDKISGGVTEVKETHRLRYLFCPELDFMLSWLGFTFLENFQYHDAKKDDWNLGFIYQKRRCRK